MSKSYDVDAAKARIRQVFQYLKEMHRVRMPPVIDLEDREWRLRLDTLPRSPHVERGFQFGSGGSADDSGYGEFILKVGRPPEPECPEPSVVIANWLKQGWNRVDAAPDTFLRKSRRVRGATQRFDASEERQDALEEWLARKQEWEAGARDVSEALAVFSDLFDLQARFERESEKYQLFLADGMLVMDHPMGAVRHPILVQRVELRFNASVPEFALVDSEDNPEIYTPLLRHVGVDGKGIQHVSDAVATEHFHPLGGARTSEFLKDLVQRFWSHGQYVESEDEIEAASGPVVFRQPHLLLGNRNQGLAENIDRLLDGLDERTELPESLLRVVGIETGRGEERDEDAPIDVLLTKPANVEQERVIRRLEETGAVLVQGPPGTGKSHTIANLIGHLLAQNKSILVTSHASKALRVVREKLAEPLQPLCVSVLQGDDESNRQLEESITGIVDVLASTSEKKLEREIAKLAEQRTALLARQEGLRSDLHDAVVAEYQDFEICGEKFGPAEVARKLAEWAGRHDWIPGPLEGGDMPISKSELSELYKLTRELASEDEGLLESELPDPDAFPSPAEFASLFDGLARLDKTREDVGEEFWLHDEQDPEDLAGLGASAKDAVALLADEEDWRVDCLEAGRKGGERRQLWLELTKLIERCASEIPEKEPLVLKHGPKVRSDQPLDELIKTCRSIIVYLESGKKLGKLSKLMRPEWNELLKAATVGTGRPSTVVHFQALLHYLEIQVLRETLSQRWDAQLEPLGAPEASELGKRPERRAADWAVEIQTALDWHADVWSRCQAEIEETGLDWSRLLAKAAEGAKVASELQRIREVALEQLPPLLEARHRTLDERRLAARRAGWLAQLDGFSRQDAAYPVIKLMRSGIQKSDYDAFADGRARLADLIAAQQKHSRRKSLLDKLEVAAPGWAAAIREGREPHGAGCIPGDLEKAWRYRLWEEQLARTAGMDLDALQEQQTGVEDELFEVSAGYVEKRSWLAQLRRTGLQQQQALTGWLGLHKKIGKGGGKHVALLKEEAKKTLAECRSAVPVWIMPLSRVVECFDMATTRFDVVIIDEASQSDVLGLVAFALGSEVVVVGDHEQVSPYAVGQSSDRIRALIDELLPDIPNRHLYDGKTSVYDLARQSFGGTIRLLEHFRCVPDIIQFSNQLCYEGEIRALREAASSRVTPHLVAHQVQDGVESNGINENEALEIVSLVSAICKLDEYEDATIGVISMVGTDQALYIDSVLRKRLSISEYKKRQILCGNASQFQGDERDVIFLSIVNSPDEAPLRLRQREESRKSFNVAASRARDQLWVVHSLNPRRDLKPGDLRLQLIAHAQNPKASRPKKLEDRKRFSSNLEKGVFTHLQQAGHRLVQRYPVGEYVIDLVVEGARGRRAAIQCAGDRARAPEAIGEDLERQRTLRRLGWEFVRVRGSEFYRDAEATMTKLRRRLAELEIEPVPPEAEAAESDAADPLHTRVVKRAELIRSRWKGIPTVSEVRAAPPLADPEAEAEPEAEPSSETASEE
jgi:very-short-patch-repair endonuclease